MDIYNYISLINDTYNIRVRVYDFTSERNIFNRTGDEDESLIDMLEEYNQLDQYEVESVDVWWCEDEKRICFEINVEIDEEDVDKFEEVL